MVCFPAPPPPVSTPPPTPYNVLDHSLCGDGYRLDDGGNECKDIDECSQGEQELGGQKGRTTVVPGVGLRGLV